MHAARWLLGIAVLVVQGAASAQQTAGAIPADCAGWVGSWSGTWSQGFYGTQWIHVTAITPDCRARVAYNPTGPQVPATARTLPVREGVIEFVCNGGTGGVCRFERVGDLLRARYSESSGFVNLGTFHKLR